MFEAERTQMVNAETVKNLGQAEMEIEKLQVYWYIHIYFYLSNLLSNAIRWIVGRLLFDIILILLWIWLISIYFIENILTEAVHQFNDNDDIYTYKT